MKTLRKVILERSKNVKRKQADLANKIDQRGGPRSAAEADVVNRENARQEGQAGNKTEGAKAKRQVGRTGKNYWFDRYQRATARVSRRAAKHRETGTDGAALHRAKNAQAAAMDRKVSAKHENSDINIRYLKPVRIDEINIVKGELRDGNGTRRKAVGSLTRTAIKRREDGEETGASEKTLARVKISGTNAAAARPSKFPGPRVRTNAKKPMKSKPLKIPDVQLGGTAAERAQKEVGDNPERYR